MIREIQFYSVRVTDSSDIAGQTTWKIINPKDLDRNKDNDLSYTNWDYSVTDSSQNEIIVQP